MINISDQKSDKIQTLYKNKNDFRDYVESDLKKEKEQEEIEDLKHYRELREKYAEKIFEFMKNFLMISGTINTVFIIAIICGANIHHSIMVTSIGTLGVAMGLFGWVVKGLFPTSK